MEHFGAVVAGGGSQRYGRDKALEKLGSNTFLDLAVALLRTQKPDSLVILGRPELDLGIADTEPGGGPARNLAAWINTLPKPCRITVLPVDMPGLDTGLLTLLTKHATGAYFDDLYLPFSANVTGDLPSNIIKMRDLLSLLGVARLDWPVGMKNQLKNINTPDDFSHFRS